MQYKTHKLANGISQEERHECKFYESIDQWDAQSTTKSSKKIFHEQTTSQFTKIVENNTTMVNFFEKTNVVLERITCQMD